jgi:hypothetical protein
MNYEVPKSRLEDIQVDQYRDSASLAQWTQWLLYAQIAVSLAAVWSGVLERETLQSIQAGLYESEDASTKAAQLNDQRQGMIALGQLAIFILSGIFCLRWIHRMSHNARIQATHMEYTPGWSIGWYFVPIAYWWKPFQAMKEIWEKSVDQAGPRGVDSSGLLGVWWAFWIASSLLSNASFRTSVKPAGFDGALSANYVTMASDLIAIPLAIVFIVMVKRLTAMQEYAHQNPIDPATRQDLRGANW